VQPDHHPQRLFQGPSVKSNFLAIDKLPFAMQDHGNPARFRNVWIRELKD